MDTILKAIPHRPPFLFVDAILEERPDGLIASRTLRADEAFFAGHYPNNPIMPGVLICESVFQAAAIYLSRRLANEGLDVARKVPVLVRIQDARFRRIVKPGEKMVIEVTFKESMSHFHFLKGVVKVEDQLAVSITFALGMIEPEKA